MSQSQYPPISTSVGVSYSTVPPTNASSVLLDGQFVPKLPTASGTVVISGATNNINQPWGLAFDTQQNLWIVNNNNTLVRVASGTSTATVQISGTANNINYPNGIAFDAQQNIWIVNSASNTLVKVNSGTTTANEIGRAHV